MIRNNIRSSYGNKDFIYSIIAALDQLKTDEFINLFLKAEDPSVYKLSKGETDAHTKLLFEIVQNLPGMGLEKDHGELVLQALYAAPAISELSKLMTMLSVGATFDYKDFDRLFGKGGDFSLNAKKNRTYKYQEELECARYAFHVGSDQSEDVRFLIDKFKVIEKAFSTDATEAFFHTLMHCEFTADSFLQLLDAFPEHKKPALMHFAPESVFTSERALELLDRGYIRPYADMTPLLTTAFAVENGALVAKAVSLILDKDYRERSHEQLDKFILLLDSKELTEGQVAIKNALVDQVNVYELELAKTQPISFSSNAPEYLLKAFDLGSLDQFTKLMTAACEIERARDYLMPVFMEIVHGAQRVDITEDHLKMVSLLKERILEQVNNLAESVKIGARAPEADRHSHHRMMMDERSAQAFDEGQQIH